MAKYSICSDNNTKLLISSRAAAAAAAPAAMEWIVAKDTLNLHEIVLSTRHQFQLESRSLTSWSDSFHYAASQEEGTFYI